MSHLNTLKGLVLGMALATPALASAATEGPSGLDFYDVPAISTTTHGDLIWYREGQGIVALGQLDTSGRFVASEVLAKHDENYMPPEVKEALERAHIEGKEAMSEASY